MALLPDEIALKYLNLVVVFRIIPQMLQIRLHSILHHFVVYIIFKFKLNFQIHF